MPSVSFKFDKDRWNKSIRDIVVATKKDAPDVVNRALLNVGYRAAEYTPFRSAADIQQELLDNKTALRIVTARLRGKIGSKVTITRGKRVGQTRTISRVTRKQIGAAATRLIAKRKAGSRVSRVGWFKSIKEMGGNIRGEGKLKPGGSASRGFAVKATIATPEGLIANAVFGKMKGTARSASQQAMVNALQRAATRVRRENVAYALKKIGGTLKKHSD